MAELLTASLSESLAADASSVSTTACSALSALLHSRASPPSLDASQWADLWTEAMAAVGSALGRRAGPAVLRALQLRWVAAFRRRWKKAAPQSPSSPLLHSSASSSSASSAAFAVSCFVLDERYALQASELLLPAFAAFPSLPYLLLSLPYDVPTFPLLHTMTPVPRRRSSSESEAAYGYPHQLYLLHRTTALSLHSSSHSSPHLGRPVDVAVAEATAEDEADVERLLSHLAKAQRRGRTEVGEEAAQSVARQLKRWRAGLRPPSSASSSAAVPPSPPSPPCCLVVRCAGELVGVVRTAPLQSAQQLTALHAHFDLEGVTASPVPSLSEQRILRLLTLNPLFDAHCPLVLQETLRLSLCSVLHYPVHSSSSSSPSSECGSFHPLLLSHLLQRSPLTLPSPPLPSSVSRAALHFSSASQDARGSPSPMAAKDLTATAFVPPGPPLAPLTSAEGRKGCTACGDCECPTFALYSASFSSISRGRRSVNSRVVVVGGGVTALAALERLLMDDAVHLPHIQCLARFHPHLHEEEREADVDGATLSPRLLDGLLPSSPLLRPAAPPPSATQRPRGLRRGGKSSTWTESAEC